MSAGKHSRKSGSDRLGGGRARRWRRLALAALLAPLAALAQNNGCGPLQNSFGPHDYRVVRGEPLYLVESAHFTPLVEAGIGSVTGYIGGDLDYTLRAFPNHHRALLTVIRLSQKTKEPQYPKMSYPFECYFDRAIRFQPDDPIPRMLYATFLSKHARVADAKRQLAAAAEIAADNPFTHYNLGMVYADLKAYDEALEQAHKAYRLGFPQPLLRERLQTAGKWRDDVEGGKRAATP